MVGGQLEVIVCGSRTWTDKEIIRIVIAGLAATHGGRVTIVHGGANGADTLGALVAMELGLPVIEHKANWQEHGKAAGPIRNNLMLDEHDVDLVVAFVDNFVTSKGTRHMVDIAGRAGVKTMVIEGNPFGREPDPNLTLF